MSVFTKRRKIIRKRQEIEQKRWEENIKAHEKSMNDVLETINYIADNHPEFESLSGDERVKLFATTHDKITNKNK